MISIKKWMMAASGIVFCLALSISIAQAEPIDITYCLSLNSTMVSETQELNIHSFDFKGIARSNLESKAFDNLTFHGIGVGRDLGDKRMHRYGYIKFMDPDGDFVILESIREGDETHCKFLQGTGKWKGIKGEGKVRRIAIGKPISPGTSQYCTRHIGTYELPKKSQALVFKQAFEPFLQDFNNR